MSTVQLEMQPRRWWTIYIARPGDAQPRFLAKCEATEREITEACGPYVRVEQNGKVVVYGKPR